MLWLFHSYTYNFLTFLISICLVEKKLRCIFFWTSVWQGDLKFMSLFHMHFDLIGNGILTIQLTKMRWRSNNILFLISIWWSCINSIEKKEFFYRHLKLITYMYYSDLFFETITIATTTVTLVILVQFVQKLNNIIHWIKFYLVNSVHSLFTFIRGQILWYLVFEQPKPKVY